MSTPRKRPKLGKGAPSVSSSEFSSLSKMSQKELGDKQASSMPDEWDYQNIEQALGRFEYDHPGLINRLYNDLCTELALSGIKKGGDLGQGLRKGFWLPSSPKKNKFDLQLWMEKAYPSFWRDEKHMRWFMRKFPQFSFEYATKRVKT